MSNRFRRVPALLLACLSWALLTPPAQAAAPAIHFEQEVLTFQPMLEGDSVDVAFAFSNAGGQPLVIHDAVTSCGCITAGYPSRPLEPGEEGTIRTTFHSRGYGGDVDIVLLVKSSDPENPVRTLHIRGKVIRQWQVKPDRFVLTNLKAGRNYRRSLQVVNYMDTPLRIQELSAATDYIHLFPMPTEVPARGKEAFTFEVRPAALPSGKPQQLSIRIAVANARLKSVEIPVLVRLNPDNS